MSSWYPHLQVLCQFWVNQCNAREHVIMMVLANIMFVQLFSFILFNFLLNFWSYGMNKCIGEWFIIFASGIWFVVIASGIWFMFNSSGGWLTLDICTMTVQVNWCMISVNPWYIINPLRAIFFRENINIYLHFMSFLHTNKTQVVEIPPRVRQEPAYST